MSRGEINQRILEELYQKGKSGNYVCVNGIVFEENEKGDIVPIGELYKKNTHYIIKRGISTSMRYKGKNLEIISNQVVPKEPSSIIKAYKKDAITERELIQDFFNPILRITSRQ